MNSVKVLIGDDDPEQLDLLQRLLLKVRPEGVTLLTASNPAQVLDMIESDRPDYAILDVRLGTVTSFEIMRQIRYKLPVIFVTGDPIFAVEAFSFEAVDFLIKPLRQDRLEQAVRRVEALLNARQPAPVTTAAKTLCMYRGLDLVWCQVDDVFFFEAQRKYTRVVLRSYEGLLRMGISSVEESLDPKLFWRIHRSMIVNVRHVANARRDELGRLTVMLDGRQERLHVSRPNESMFRDGFV
jgi:DNA-binding LytR/AlgR family response regulator